MAVVHVTPNLHRHVPESARPARISGDTVRAVLSAYFLKIPALRGYLLEDDGAVRKHMTVFVDGEAIRDRRQLTDPVSEDAEVFIMQALSGG